VSDYQFPKGAPGQSARHGQPAKRAVPIVVSLLAVAFLLCAAAAIFYQVLFNPLGL
jgi:hypothetical protein